MPHTYLCVVDGHVALLDLREDRYLCLDRAHSAAFCAAVGIEAPVEHAAPDGSINPQLAQNAKRTVREMIEHCLVTTDPAHGKPIAPTRFERPEADLTGYEFRERPTINLVHLVRFAAACLNAAIRLRWLPFEHVVSSVLERKRRCGANAQIVDDRVRGLVAIFKTLRPLAFTSRDHCLFDSLAMINFLASYGIFPLWVFGVKVKPFVAHCWVQCEGTVFNDSVDHVTFYTSIMAA